MMAQGPQLTHRREELNLATYQCSHCQLVIEKRFPPIKCASCQQAGTYVEVQGSISDRPPVSEKTPDTSKSDFSRFESVQIQSIEVEQEAAAEGYATLGSTVNDTKSARQPVADDVLWRRQPFSSRANPYPSRGCPAVDRQGRAYLALGSTLVGLDPGDSEPVWTYVTSGMIMGSPVIGPDEVIRLHSTDGYLHLIDRMGARRCPPIALGEPLGSATLMVDSENRTWAPLSGGGLVYVDSEGRPNRQPYYRTRRRFDNAGIIREGVLYIGAEDHFVHAVRLDAARGQNVWSGRENAGRTGGAITCPLAISGSDELLVVSRDGLLYAMDWDGYNCWTFAIPGQVLGSPVVDAEGTILIGLGQSPRSQQPTGGLLAIDGDTHQLKWHLRVDSPVESTPVIGNDGVIYFGDNGGRIYALRPPDNITWVASMDAQVRSCGNFLEPGVVAFGLDDGSVVALRCSSQRLIDSAWPKFRGTIDQAGCRADTARLGSSPSSGKT